MGPWIAYGFAVQQIGYPTWSRYDFDKNVWEKVKHDA